jgi:hypothetical protein
VFTIEVLKPQPHLQRRKRRANSLTQLGRGIVPGNPTRCITCHKPIRRREAWVTLSNGQYKIIRHMRCK